MEIQCSVGYGGTSRHTDVKNVQNLLNMNRMVDQNFRAHMPEPVEVNGQCAQSTTDAIVNFQTKIIGFRYADARVDPGGKTLRNLNGNIAHPSVTPAMQATPGTPGDYSVYKQGTYKSVILGTGERSISAWGCELCTLTMAATSVGSRTEHWPETSMPSQLTPPLANRILINAGAFSGSSMSVPVGSAALGMNYEEYGRNEPLGQYHLNKLTAHVIAGNPVAAHVDYKRDDLGDHWILITHRMSGGIFTAIAPATGTSCLLKPPQTGGDRNYERKHKIRRTDARRKTWNIDRLSTGWLRSAGKIHRCSLRASFKKASELIIAGTALAALVGFATSGLPSPQIPQMVVQVSENLPLSAAEILQMFKAKPGTIATIKRGEHLKLLDLLLIFEAPDFDPMAHLDGIGIEWVLVDALPEVSINNQMDWNAVIKADGAARSGTVDLLARLSIGSKTEEIALKVEITD